jgi:hypothetical protein
MFKRYLQRPLIILWAAIIVIRTALDQWLLHQPNAGSLFDVINALFCLVVPVAEFGIFYRAFRAYSTSEVATPTGQFGISAKILLPTFFICLPYALWANRRYIVKFASIAPGASWIAIVGLAIGCFTNLYLSGMMVHLMFAEHFRRKRFVTVE